MKAPEFCYWLQGMFELSGPTLQELNAEQLNIIKQHLAMVFIHDIDPSYPKDQQAALDAAHSGNSTTQNGTTVFRC